MKNPVLANISFSIEISPTLTVNSLSYNIHTVSLAVLIYLFTYMLTYYF